MADQTAIEWTDATWNPVTGCTKISRGCANCYAERFAERFRGVEGHPFEHGFDLRVWPERLQQPYRWRRPRRVFVNRLDRDTVFKALKNYVEPRLRGETSRFDDLKSRLDAEKASLPRRERTNLEKEVERRGELLVELTSFKEALERIAALGFEPDLDDGVVLSIAPFHELVPWKEAKACWEHLRKGKYQWSTIARRLFPMGAAPR